MIIFHWTLLQGNQYRCSSVSQEALQLYVAAQWVCEKLNANAFLPGLQFGELGIE
jgi:hypothetical protein